MVSKVHLNPLSTAPIEIPASYADFQQKYPMENIANIRVCEQTRNLSQIMHTNISQGLEQWLSIDKTVVTGCLRFSTLLHHLLLPFTQSLQFGGRIIVAGTTSWSGPIAISAINQCKKKFKHAPLLALLAGGYSSLLRPEDNFKDNEKVGENTLKDLNVNEHDIVILLSGSFSLFDVGVGLEAANKNAKVYCFVNNPDLPAHAQVLFRRTHNPIQLINIDIGAQAISGPAALQTATLTQGCLSILLGSVLLAYYKDPTASEYYLQVLQGMEKGNDVIATKLDDFKQIIQEQLRLLNDPRSWTHMIRKDVNHGYITLISDGHFFSETCMHASQLPPTYNLPVIRREIEDHLPKPPLQAYRLDKPNRGAWSELMGGGIPDPYLADIDQFILGTQTYGKNAYISRPKGPGNMVVGIYKFNTKQIHPELKSKIQSATKEGASTAIIVICEKTLSASQIEQIQNISSCPPLILDGIPQDDFGIVHSLIIKQTLNMIFNAVMIRSGNVYGNQMINTSASTPTGIIQCMSLIKSIWTAIHPDQKLNEQLLYECILKNQAKINERYQQGLQSPPIVAITLAMIHYQRSSEDFEAMMHKVANQKDLSFLTELRLL